MHTTRQAKPSVVMAIACMAQYFIPVMVTAVAVILPSAGAELHASALELGLVEQVYVVAMAVSMLFFGRLGDIVGWRRLYILGFLAFSFTTGAIGLAPNIVALIVLRTLQGLAAATILSGSIALVALAYPPEVRGKKIGIIQAFTYGGLSTGPVIGGIVASTLGWRYVFWLFVPFGLLAALLCLTHLRAESAPSRREAIDWKGSLVYAASIAVLAAGASCVDKGFPGGMGITLGLVGLFYFGRLQSRTAQPLLDVTELIGNRTFALSCLAAMGNYASTFGLTFFMSLYLQYSTGLSPHYAGMILLAMPFMQMLTSPVVGRLSDRVAPIRLATLGMCVTCFGLAAATLTIGEHTPLGVIVLELLVIGAGYGIFITPNTVVIMGSVDRRRYGVASGMVGSMRTLGMVASMTTITIVLSLGMAGQAVTPQSMPAFLTCMHVGLGAFAVFSLLGIVSSSKRAVTVVSAVATAQPSQPGGGL
ncbi:MAG: MFS transporter [Solidesulfovibrio sp.]